MTKFLKSERMTIRIPDYDEVPTRMAIVDGYIPTKSMDNHEIYRINQKGMIEGISNDVNSLEKFEELTLFFNNLERKLINNTQIAASDTVNSIHHYLVYNANYVNRRDQKKVQIQKEILFSEMEKLLPESSRPDYCINIITAPFNLSNERLERYILSWLNFTGFRISKKDEYSDYNTFDKLRYKLIFKVNSVYMDPIGEALKQDIGSKGLLFNGIKLND